MFLPGVRLFTLLGLLRYVAFNTSLDLLSKKKTELYQSVLSYSLVIMLGLFLSEQILLNIIFANFCSKI